MLQTNLTCESVCLPIYLDLVDSQLDRGGFHKWLCFEELAQRVYEMWGLMNSG
jgi:hypothetical protein